MSDEALSSVKSISLPMTSDRYRFVGLDGEMTGSAKTLDFYKEYQLCQIGVALSPKEFFNSDIGFAEGEFKWTQEALDVNKFTLDRIRAGPRGWQVDAELVEWLRERNISEDTRLIAVGWNVAAFDLPFVRYYLPRFSKFIWYRTIDLNACVFLAEQVTGLSYNNIKDKAKRYAAKQVPGEVQWHNAGYDAADSIAAYEFLLKFLKPKIKWELKDDIYD